MAVIEKKYNFVYQTKNMVTNKTYVGVHGTNRLNDGYIGCGIGLKSHLKSRTHNTPLYSAVRKYGYDNFKLEVLAFFDTIDECYEEEKFIVDEKWVLDKNNYNACLGGRGRKHKISERRPHQHSSAKEVINTETGETYKCATYVADLIGVERNNLYRKLNNNLYNDTCYKYTSPTAEVKSFRVKSNLIYKNIKQYDKEGNLIRIYKDVYEINKHLKINRSSLTNHLRGNRTVYLGFVWTADKIKEGFVNKDINSWFTLVLLKDGVFTKFKTKADALIFMGYSKNSLHRVFGNFDKGKEVRGFKLYTKEGYLKAISK